MKSLVKMETINVKLLVPSALTVAAALGAGAGYLVALKVLEKKFRAIADEEIAEARIYYQKLYHRSPLVISEEKTENDGTEMVPLVDESQEAPPGTWDELSEVAQERIMTKAMQAMGTYVAPVEEMEVTEKREVTVRNTFAEYQPPGEEVLSALLADRDPSEPYIITKVEYYENEPDHEQRAFTWYEGDSVLVDDQEEYNPIQDVNRVVGEDNLLRFGYGSEDEHVIYIRNETVDPPFDLCVTRSTGKYADEVMGFDDTEPHIKHSQPRKFRLNDD